MPIFEFTCCKCGRDFEELVLSSSEKVRCPKCDSAKVEKKMSVFAHKGPDGFKASSSGST